MSINNIISEKHKVTVCVITYNHESYINKCLESIISQRCNFSFDIIIRDDCSKDNTVNIIKLFKKKYPEKIKLLNGHKNIGSLNNTLAVFAAVQGQYIAICEGDDYWIDDSKLQKQVNIMDINPNVTFTAHPCRLHDRHGLRKKPAYVKATKVIDINCNDVLRADGQFAPTASYMFRRECLTALPDWFKDAPVGDFFVEMYALSMGSGKYLPNPMSAYRNFSQNSWTNANTGDNGSARLANSTNMLTCIEKMQKSLQFNKYDFSPKIRALYFNIATANLLVGDYNAFKQFATKCQSSQKYTPIKYNLIYHLRLIPSIARFLYIIKMRLSA